ncbi:MAG: Ig-like domain-containing protein, partial [Lachnospiraceae bacterium]|nr:Ig-like domain-containing protein [Lachnospiraceae bacterium]
MRTEFNENERYEVNEGYTVGGYLEPDTDVFEDDAFDDDLEEMTDEDIDSVLDSDSDYNPFEDEATARPSVMGYLLGREARGSARAKKMRAYRTGDLKRPSARNRRRAKTKGSVPFFTWFFSLGGAEKIAMVTGLLIVILAVSVGTIYVQAMSANRSLEAFADLGTELAEVDTLGGKGLIAVADAQLAKQLAAEEAAADAAAEASTQEEEEKTSADITVIMTLTTVQSDLKIKFINYDTNRRVTGVPFTVLVIDPDGNEKVYDDHDQDGIIYLKDLKSGTYKVRMRALPLDYSKYAISTETLPIKVKETIEYKGIDIVDEIKTESEVNVAKEDHKKEETPVESVNKDTVEWVESTKREVSPGTANAVTEGNTEYVRIEKSTIKDPMTVAFSGNSFLRLSGRSLRTEGAGTSSTDPVDPGEINPSTADVILDKDGSASVNLNPSGTVLQNDISAKSDNESVATCSVDSTDRLTINGKSPGSATITVGYNNKTFSINVTVKDNTPEYNLSTGESAITLEKGASKDVTISASPEGGDPKLSVTSSDANVATAELIESGSKVRIKAVAKGSVRVTVSYAGKTAEIQVTVNETAQPTINVTPDTVALKAGETVTLAASVEGLEDRSVTWSVTAGSDIVKVDENGKVTGLKEGSATVRGTSKAKTDLYDETKVTVTVDAEKLKATLKDNEGREVYVKEGSSYRLATGADYSKFEDFYVLTSTSKAYVYTGWQTLSGKTYYFDKNGNKVTGEQVINGAKYTFNSDGSLSAGSGNMGIDVSKWNGNIDWVAVRNSGVSFVIIRCGYRGMDTGALIEDPKFRQNIQGASSAGLKVGVYFFSQAINEVEAVEEASMAISLCRNYKLTYPIFLDVESGGRANGIGVDMRTKVCKAFCATVSNAGYKAGVYANKTWFNSYINTPELTGYKLWLAQYAAAPSYTRTRYDMWQYSSKGRVSGISGNVDMNISYLG